MSQYMKVVYLLNLLNFSQFKNQNVFLCYYVEIGLLVKFVKDLLVSSNIRFLCVSFLSIFVAPFNLKNASLHLV